MNDKIQQEMIDLLMEGLAARMKNPYDAPGLSDNMLYINAAKVLVMLEQLNEGTEPSVIKMTNEILATENELYKDKCNRLTAENEKLNAWRDEDAQQIADLCYETNERRDKIQQLQAEIERYSETACIFRQVASIYYKTANIREEPTVSMLQSLIKEGNETIRAQVMRQKEGFIEKQAKQIQQLQAELDRLTAELAEKQEEINGLEKERLEVVDLGLKGIKYEHNQCEQQIQQLQAEREVENAEKQGEIEKLKK